MDAVVDVVGHFGSTFSYATVASQVVRQLRAEGLLGQVLNLDDGWHPSYVDLRPEARPQRGSHVIAFVAPRHFIDVFAEQYGRDNAAIFASPNTDEMAPEHVETCDKFGLVIAPSKWCERVVREQCQSECTVLPLGVENEYATLRYPRGSGGPSNASATKRRIWRLEGPEPPEGPVRVVHFSTDQSWPGRKGTEELLDAWSRLSPRVSVGAELAIHLPQALLVPATYRVRDLELTNVRLVAPPPRGSSSLDLANKVGDADLIVAPSRCEGYGMMLQAALVAGTPLLCTYNTGHCDFLRGRGGWLGIPTFEWAPLAGEHGSAPVVESEVLAATLGVALQPATLLQLQSDAWGESELQATWPYALQRWMARIREWVGIGEDGVAQNQLGAGTEASAR